MWSQAVNEGLRRNSSTSAASVLGLFIALGLVRGLLYTVLIPPWQAPDEPQHYQMVRLTSDGLVSPQESSQERSQRIAAQVLQSLRDNRFWEYRYRRPAPTPSDSRTAAEILREEKLAPAVGHPPLYYGLAVAALYPFRSASVAVQLYVLRGLSIVFSLVTVWCIFTVGRWAWIDGSMNHACAATLFVVFLPMRTFISAAANNDALAEMMASLTITVAIWCCWRGLAARQAIVLVVLMLLGLFTKRTNLFLLPLVVGFLFWRGRNRAGRGDGGATKQPHSNADPNGHGRLAVQSQRSCAVLATALLFAVFITAVFLLDGVTRHWWDVPARFAQLWQADRYTAQAFNVYGLWVLLTFASFWGNFGWMNIPLDVGGYVILAVATLALTVGVARVTLRAWRSRRQNYPKCWAMGFCISAILLVVAQSGASMVARQMPPQGRYLFPAMLPIALGFAWGLFEWIPPKYHPLAPGIAAASLIVLDSASLLGYVLPYFYG